jgi:hypothetical protein
MSDAHAPYVPTQVPSENVGRGALVALATVPVGVAAWVVLWGFGFIASLVAFGVAVLAMRLYLWGAGSVTRKGAMVVLGVTVVTLLLAFFAGIVLDAAQAFGEGSGLGAWGAFRHANFWPAFWDVWPDAAPEYLPDFGLAAVFGALGSFRTLRAVFAATAVQPAPPAQPAQPLQQDQAAGRFETFQPFGEPFAAPQPEPYPGQSTEPEAPERP